jgi:hypothetical protein
VEDATAADVKIASETGRVLGVGVGGGDDENSSEKGLVLGAGVDWAEIVLSPRVGIFLRVEGVEGVERVGDSTGDADEARSVCDGESSETLFLFFLDFRKNLNPCM